jgi:hypothetical protein
MASQVRPLLYVIIMLISAYFRKFNEWYTLNALCSSCLNRHDNKGTSLVLAEGFSFRMFVGISHTLRSMESKLYALSV